MKINRRLIKYFIICFVLLKLSYSASFAQSLSFTQPGILFSNQQTDKAPAIVNFKGNFFIAWKAAGNTGNIYFTCTGNQYNTKDAVAVQLPSAQSAFPPALRVLNNRLYLLWIDPNGKLSYLINNTETSFNVSEIKQVTITGDTKISLGLTAAAVGNDLVLATHANNKDKMLYGVLKPDSEGYFGETPLQEIAGEKSRDYPFVINLTNSSSRFCWHGKDDLIYYADYNTGNNNWTKSQVKGPAQTKVSPAIFHVWDTDKLFYIWRGNKTDNRIYYKTATDKEIPTGNTVLPAYFTTELPVSICKVDENNFLMAYTSTAGQLNISKFSSYQPAKWMEQILHPKESNKTLKDIVIPGAHDAGMSVLSATGGQQKGTINECNTLTQKLNIKQQLDAGIRMFDLRAGSLDNVLHAKHCASDCMEDAIGGGYGESLEAVGIAIREFLVNNNQEIIVLSFSHFCERETPLKTLKDSLQKWIGAELLYSAVNTSSIGMVPLKELAGKVIISLETTGGAENKFPSCSIADESAAFINFRRAYAATNDINKLLEREKTFFVSLSNTLHKNDLIRLDWQLTQSTAEAPLICNDFEDEKLNPVVNGLMLLANKINKNKSIIDHSLEGNRYLPQAVTGWVNDGTINKNNKPNILYVDVAGAWITDFCIDLLKDPVYQEK